MFVPFFPEFFNLNIQQGFMLFIAHCGDWHINQIQTQRDRLATVRAGNFLSCGILSESNVIAA